MLTAPVGRKTRHIPGTADTGGTAIDHSQSLRGPSIPELQPCLLLTSCVVWAHQVLQGKESREVEWDVAEQEQEFTAERKSVPCTDPKLKGIAFRL